MAAAAPQGPRGWRTPEELVAVGFDRSRVVMMNEGHDGLKRCIRTRRVGQRVLVAAHEAGVRHLAMEALTPAFAAEANETRALPVAAGGYLAQAEMRDLIEDALELGWTLVPYEADMCLRPSEFEHLSSEETNWRDDQQARNLVSVLKALPGPHPLFVWCGNSHLLKVSVQDLRPMGFRFRELSGIEPFAIDQLASVRFGGREPFGARWVTAHEAELRSRGVELTRFR